MAIEMGASDLMLRPAAAGAQAYVARRLVIIMEELFASGLFHMTAELESHRG